MSNVILKVFLFENICDYILYYIGDYDELHKIKVYDPKYVGQFEANYSNINVKDNNLIKFSNLKILNCGNNLNNFTDVALQKSGKTLEELDCGNDINEYFTNKKFMYFRKLKVLKCGAFYEIANDGIMYLHRTLEELHCGSSNMYVTNDCLKCLKKLKILKCDYNTKFTNEGINYLKKLEELDCGHNYNLTDVFLDKLESLKKVTYYDGVQKINIVKLKEKYPNVKFIMKK
jgi:Leucine-rich repeat (LRR) protein